MAVNVEIINNPYSGKLKILINGEAVSVYSNLEKFLDEPFSYWCDKVFNAISEECNGDHFRLHFCSRTEELRIMEKLASAYPDCIQYSSSRLVRDVSLTQRIKDLNKIVKSIPNKKAKKFSKTALFIIPESLKAFYDDLLGLEVANSFCDIKSKVIYYQDCSKSIPAADIIFVLSDDNYLDRFIRKYNINCDFGIVMGRRNSFIQKKEKMFVYETTDSLFFETIFDCLLFIPLLDIFRACIDSLPLDIRDKNRESIETLQSVSLKVIPVPETTQIELGISSRLKFKTDIEGYEINASQLNFRSEPKGIIKCNGMLVEGIKEGNATLYIYKEGEHTPCAQVNYNVIRRNRITDIKLDESSICIGEGDRLKLDYTYLPADADNADKIEWQTDDASIAKIDKYGYVTAVKKGSCTLRCYAERVCSFCRCTVKPHLRSITPDKTELIMVYGDEQNFHITLAPENSIDDEIMASSMDMRIANVVGRTIKAVGEGSTTIVIQNKQESVRTEIRVTVMNEKNYKKMLKNKEKENKKNSVGSKQGLLSRLFK